MARTQAENRAALLTAVFVSSQFIYMYSVAPELGPRQASEPPSWLDTMVMVAAVLSVIDVLLVYVLENRLLAGFGNARAKAGKVPSRYMSLLIVGLACAAAPGIYGLVLHMLGMSFGVFQGFAYGSVAATIAWQIYWYRKGYGRTES